MNGECTGSTFIKVTKEADAAACLNFCKGQPGCQYFTFYENEGGCFSFLSCTNLSTEGCTDCISGDVECEDQQCDLQGLCDGALVKFDSTANKDLCILECQSIPECLWWSYNNDNGFCIMSADCLYLDSTYTNTQAGERACEASPPPPPDAPGKITLVFYFNIKLESVCSLQTLLRSWLLLVTMMATAYLMWS